MRLAEPGWLVLLLLVVLPWWYQRVRPRIAWPSIDGFGGKGRAGLQRLGFVPVLLRGLAIAALAVALARPQSVGGRTRIAGRGVAIVVALDQSSSMNTADFPAEPPSTNAIQKAVLSPAPIARLEAAKATFVRFVEGRPDDLIGLVVFANQPDLACPPTLDHRFLVDQARAVRSARPDEDGTNIGDAIVWALESLRGASPKKKVLILLTDGRNSPARTAGAAPMEPEEAAELARDLGVTLHTIAVGKAGGIVRTPEAVTKLDRVAAEVAGPDLALLQRLAQIGRGRSFAATDTAALGRIFQTLDALEKSPVRGEVRTRYREEYAPWVAVALAALVLDRLLSAGRLRRYALSSAGAAFTSIDIGSAPSVGSGPSQSTLALDALAALAGSGGALRVVGRSNGSALGQGGQLRGDGAIAWLAAIACLILALAQPRWGRVPTPPLPPGRDVVLLVDDSRSMAAEDAVPDRLGVAVEAASSLVGALARQPGNRVAVVAFAGRGVLRCPLTENLGAVSDTLRTLRPGDVRPGGTDLGAGLTVALEAFGNREQEPEQAGGRTVVLFSDGEDHAGSSAAAAQRLQEAGIVVHAVAVGDAEHGHPVPLDLGEGTLAYNGAPVLSRRMDTAPAAIAETTGGAVVPLGLAATDLGELYLNRIEPIARQKRLVFRASERAERFGWFVLAALVLGLTGSWPGHRGRELRGGTAAAPRGLLALVGLAAGGEGNGRQPGALRPRPWRSRRVGPHTVRADGPRASAAFETRRGIRTQGGGAAL